MLVRNSAAVLMLTAGLGAADVGMLRADEPNTLTDAERQAGFELLFDGRTTTGWESKPTARWKIDDGAIFVVDAGDDPYEPGIVCRAKKLPEDFDLRFEWRETSWQYAVRPQEFVTNGCIGRECWSRSNTNYADGKSQIVEFAVAVAGFEAGGRRLLTTTGLVEFPPENPPRGFSETSQRSRDLTRPVGQWNSARIVHQRGVIQHWLNGRKVNEENTRDATIQALPSQSRRWTAVMQKGTYVAFNEGPFLSGRPAWYRSIKARAIGPDEPLDSTPIVGE
jgi:hypothetical protein